MGTITVRAAEDGDRDAIDALHERVWGGPIQVGHDERFDLRTLPTLIAEQGQELRGALVWRKDGDALEIVSIATVTQGEGIGTALLEAAHEKATGKTWLVTTNDNLRALRFYQRRGMRIVAVDPGAVDRSRAIKPEIPLVGQDGIEIHDELRLERER
jgi:ribosomal protein S18 acetylase RimI-like enzyme